MARLTGLATGLDVDALVKTAMSGYKTKVNQQIQQKDILEIKQKLYRQTLTDTRSFYNKYLDIAKSDSLLFTSNYKSVTFTSSDEAAVTVKSSSQSPKDNYKVTVTTLASAASAVIDKGVVAGAKVTINDKEFILAGTNQTEIAKDLSTQLASAGIKVKARYTNFAGKDSNNVSGLVLESTVLGEKGKFTAKGTEFTTITPEISIIGENATEGTDATESISKFNDTDILKKMIMVNNSVVDLTSVTTEEELNELLKDKGLTAKINGAKITFTSIEKGPSSAFTIEEAKWSDDSNVIKGNDANIKIENLTSGGVYIHQGNTNTLSLDGSTFTFNNTTGATPISITAKTDVSDIKDKMVKFVNDYNTLMTSLNTNTMTKHNRNYSPLTDEQKEAMSESEIKLWNERVEAGQLYRDSDITKIANNMKEAMRSVMGGTGMTLAKIGITPVKDYAGTSNGTFTIDEEKLTSALENNIEDVMNLFTGKPDDTAKTDVEKNAQTGILNKIKTNLYAEVMKSDSALAKKVGIEGTASFTSNTITKNISDYEKKITDMQKALSTREQALYVKYANLETIMNKYNSQQSYLTSSLGS